MSEQEINEVDLWLNRIIWLHNIGIAFVVFSLLSTIAYIIKESI